MWEIVGGFGCFSIKKNTVSVCGYSEVWKDFIYIFSSEMFSHIYMGTDIRDLCVYRMSQEECARLRQGFPYVKVYWYNPKHLCPKLNGYRDNGQRKVVFWRVLALYLSTDNLIHVRPWVWCHITAIQLTLALNCLCPSFLVIRYYMSVLGIQVMYSAWNPKDNYDMSASVFVVQFNGFMSLTS